MGPVERLFFFILIVSIWFPLTHPPPSLPSLPQTNTELKERLAFNLHGASGVGSPNMQGASSLSLGGVLKPSKFGGSVWRGSISATTKLRVALIGHLAQSRLNVLTRSQLEAMSDKGLSARAGLHGSSLSGEAMMRAALIMSLSETGRHTIPELEGLTSDALARIV